jgi:hypothetical protein
MGKEARLSREILQVSPACTDARELEEIADASTSRHHD